MAGRLIYPVFWQLATRVLNFGTPIGRRVLPMIKAGKHPLVRVTLRAGLPSRHESVPGRAQDARIDRAPAEPKRAHARGGRRKLWLTRPR